jgi:hypothetical protein
MASKKAGLDKDSRQHVRDMQRIGRNRLARSLVKTRRVMSQRQKARTEFAESLKGYEQRESVLIPKV